MTKTFVTITYRQRLEVLDTLERLVRVTQDWREPYAYRARLQFATNRLKQYVTDWVVETDAQYLTRMRAKWAVELSADSPYLAERRAERRAERNAEDACTGFNR